jgi:hypothetical protein
VQTTRSGTTTPTRLGQTTAAMGDHRYRHRKPNDEQFPPTRSRYSILSPKFASFNSNRQHIAGWRQGAYPPRVVRTRRIV